MYTPISWDLSLQYGLRKLGRALAPADSSPPYLSSSIISRQNCARSRCVHGLDIERESILMVIMIQNLTTNELTWEFKRTIADVFAGVCRTFT